MMDENQRKAIQKLSPKLIRELDVDAIRLELAANQILTEYDVDVISNITFAGERRQKFLSTIINKENSWSAFLIALDNSKQHYLRNELESEASGIQTEKFQKNFILQLEDYIVSEAQEIRRFWIDFLHIENWEDIYQPLEIVEIREQQSHHELVEGYDFIWNNPDRKIRVFVIDGDPGIGKTTWMNKLAVEWTNKDKPIRQHFDLLFLIPLRRLKSATHESFLKYLCNIFHPKFDTNQITYYLKQSGTILLLDGFDENPSCIEWIKELTFRNGYHSKVVITCRGSHFHEIRDAKIFDMRLMVKGFKDDEAIKKFFQSLKCPNGNQLINSYSQLPEMCKVPMIAAILCSICKHDDVSKSIAEDENRSLFLIFKNFAEMLINMTNEKRPGLITETKNEMKAAGILGLATVKYNNSIR